LIDPKQCYQHSAQCKVKFTTNIKQKYFLLRNICSKNYWDDDDDDDGDNNNNNHNKNEKEKLKKLYVRRLRLILNTELSAKNKMQGIGSLAVTVLRYSFGIINWHQEEIQKLDRKTRKILTIH
jgi:hypothetical protein